MLPKIIFDDVSYHFRNSKKLIVSGVNLVIDPGQCVGFIGKTGSGKTTLINLIMGLFSPSIGEIRYSVNGQTCLAKDAKRLKFGYVSQNIVLVDRSIAENIALTATNKDMNYKYLGICSEIAELKELVENLPEGLDTFVGERGIRLSGGQRQRIAIARALYSDPSVLILDEATSALDKETEATIIDNIRNLNKKITIIMISHRTDTLKICDKIYEIKAGKIISKKI